MSFIDQRLSKLLVHFTRYHHEVFWASLHSVLNKLLDLAPPLLIGLAVDIVVKQQESYLAYWYPQPLHQLYVLGVLTVLVWGGESWFEYFFQKRWRELAQKVQRDLRQELYAHLQTLDSQWFAQQETGDLLATLNDDVNQLERFFNVGANHLIQLLTTTLTVSFYFFYVAPSVAYWAMLPIPLIIWGSLKFQKAIGPRYSQVRQQAAKINAQLNHTLRGMEEVKSFTAEQRELKRLDQQSLAYLNANQAAIGLSAAFTPMIRMAIVIGFLATLIYGGYLTLEGDLAVGTYSVLVFLTQRLLWPLTRLGETLDLYQRAMASAERAFRLLEVATPQHQGQLKPDLDCENGLIDLRQVDFAYDEHPIFKSLNISFPMGQTSAIVGATGSGKSTLIKLLLGFNRPQAGELWVNELPLRDIDLTYWRQQIGLVSQQVYLFEGTIMENIRYGRPSASDDEVYQAAQLAGVTQFVTSLSAGYETKVGEGGIRLSGGERQRVSIARALLKNPKILILDEATSAVDAYTEAEIQKALKSFCQGRTVLIIAHRLNTIRHADQILVLEQGQVIEQGTHKDLLESQGLYAQLWQS